MRRRLISLLLAGAIGALTYGCQRSSNAERPPVATLVARALLAADTTAPAPFRAARGAEPVPASGATQPVGGFSALLRRGRTFWAMPDNGFGEKADSRSFLLRVYRVRARFAADRTDRVDVRGWITLRDPDRRVPFAIVRRGTPDRLLTGADFDVESMRFDRRGTLWFGDEYGPFLLNTDATGKVLRAPIALPGVKSPDYPRDHPPPVAGAANVGSSRGFEAMALTADGSRLLPMLEGPLAGDDRRLRRMYEFDLRRMRYTPRRRTYRVSKPELLVSDLAALDADTLVALERDDAEGAAASHKRVFVVDFGRRAGRRAPLAKRWVVDLLRIADPRRISLPGRPGDIGLGSPFAMPYLTTEAVLPLGGDRLALVNDTNFGSRGRNPQLPDDSEFIVVRAPRLRDR